MFTSDKVKQVKKTVAGISLFLGLVLLLVVFLPAIIQEIKYLYNPYKDGEVKVITHSHVEEREPIFSCSAGKNKSILFSGIKNDVRCDLKNTKKQIVFTDDNFGLVIPKIGVNVSVVENVDPLDQEQYSQSLKQGVVHSKFSGLPDDNKTMFIFGHSSNNVYDLGGYNFVFYLLSKLVKGDVFYIAYKGDIYKYKVVDKKTVSDRDVDYLKFNDENVAVMLMTCWPPGTDKKRLLIFARQDGES